MSDLGGCCWHRAKSRPKSSRAEQVNDEGEGSPQEESGRGSAMGGRKKEGQATGDRRAPGAGD